MTTDSGSAVPEYNGSPNTAEANNAATVSKAVTLAPYPDLTVSGVALAPTAPGGVLQSGTPVTLNWTTTNAGTAAAPSGFREYATVVNTVSGATLFSQVLTYSGAALAAGTSAARSANFTLPDGPGGAGPLSLTVRTDYYNEVFEYNAGGTAETNNTATGAATAALAPYPDLTVTGVGLTAPGGTLQSGAAVVVAWATSNGGTKAAPAGFREYVTVVKVNPATGATLATLYSQVLTYTGAALAAGGSAARSAGFTLPDGPDGAGTLRVTVRTDYYDEVFEYNAGGTGEANNTGTADVSSALAPYPDLTVSAVSLTPTAGGVLRSGAAAVVTWATNNGGTAAAPAGYREYVTVVNQDTGATLLSTVVTYSGAAIPAGTSVSRFVGVTLPDGPNGVGTLRVTVRTDYYNEVFEYAPGGTDAEANNATSADFASVLAGYPDLVPSAVTGPAAGVAGRTAAVSWTTANAGNRTASAPWLEQVILADNAAGTGGTVVGTLAAPGDLAAAATAARSLAVTLPASLVGDYWLVVLADSGNAVTEYNAGGTGESNNRAVAAQRITIGAGLGLTVSPAGFAENAAAATATVTRSGPTAAALAVTITNSDPTAATTPASVTIPAGQASATFAVTPVNDAVVDGTQTTTVGVSAAGLAPASAVVTVTDDDAPTLTVTIDPGVITEGQTATATVRRNTSTAAALTPRS